MSKTGFSYSRPSSDAIRESVLTHYDLPLVSHCRFYIQGLHDNYYLDCGEQKFILRLYRKAWRAEEEIFFELELLAFLDAGNAPVAGPLLNRAGRHYFVVDCPEGKRIAALFYYAAGDAPGHDLTAGQSALLGVAVAGFHQLSDKFSTAYTRCELNVEYLLDESLEVIRPFIDSEAQSYLESLQESLKENLPLLSKQDGVFGICSGDISSNNFHINKRNEIILFDFDQCGHGYRAFEIGKFFSSIYPSTIKQVIEAAFLGGYQQVRCLANDELKAIPCFEIISLLWVMAIHARNAEYIGYKLLNSAFWNRQLGRVKELAANQTSASYMTSGQTLRD